MINGTLSRIGIFGASDTKKMFMGFHTKGFQEFWAKKTGELVSTDAPNKYMLAGSLLEQDVLNCISKNLGIEIVHCSVPYVYYDNEKLQVNLDGLYDHDIYEVKCCQYEDVFLGKVTSEKWYEKQVVVQMFVTGFDKGYLAYYGMLPFEYDAEFLTMPEIDFERIDIREVVYDEAWLKNDYVPKLEFLSRCLDDGVKPWEVENETDS